MLNSSLNIEALAAQYQQDDRIRIVNILDESVTESVAQCCETKVPFDFIYHIDGENKVTPARDMAAISPGDQQSLHKKLMQAASQGVGFLYSGYMMNLHADSEDPELSVLHELVQNLSSEESLDAFRQITGIKEISGIDAQYTCYNSGHFLTRHSDNISAEGRRVAFVFGFSRSWHPDWGGLLQFYENDGTPRDAWLPEFNTLALFDVRHIHSVSYVTPFAAGPRISLTGWFTTG